jgi:hypothetical protein
MVTGCLYVCICVLEAFSGFMTMPAKLKICLNSGVSEPSRLIQVISVVKFAHCSFVSDSRACIERIGGPLYVCICVLEAFSGFMTMPAKLKIRLNSGVSEPSRLI